MLARLQATAPTTRHSLLAMRISLKLALAVLAAIVVVHAGYGAFRVQRETAMFQQDMRRDHRVLAKALVAAAANTWSAHGPAGARTLIDEANARHDNVFIRWSPEGPSALESAVLRDDGERKLITTVPVIVDAGVVGWVRIEESLAAETAYVRATMLRWASATIVTLLATLALTLIVGLWVVGRPMRALVEHARRVGVGDFAATLQLRQRDEIGLLADELDRMTEQLAQARDRVAKETAQRVGALEQLRHADRLMTVGTLASGLAHELGTPLNVVMGRAKMIATGEVQGEEAKRYAKIVEEQTGRMSKIIRDLLDFARRRGPQRSPLDLHGTVHKTLALLEPMARRHNVKFERVGEPCAVQAEADSAQLQQALANIVVNGVQAMAERGGTLRVHVATRRARRPSELERPAVACATIDIRDEGPGIPQDVIAHVFDPFFTTKPVGEGTGLGLSVAHGIVQDHGGWIEVGSKLGAGAAFTIFLPEATSP